jgi:dipeptidyl aminopeptidase/acylaminoacyl peptidase
VFYLNPRGSTGYGHGFTWDIWEGWGEKDEEDFVTGIEAMLEAYPAIDADRLGVTGWSYGGFMTNWLTARTDLFAAAVTGASIADWESDAGTTDLWWTIFNEFGPLWEAREVYRRLSPLSYVEHVSAPTLILHGEHDVRVPYKNAEQWFRALKMRGIPTELVRYPRSAHGIREPWLAVDRLARTRSWLLHWLADEDGEGEGR